MQLGGARRDDAGVVCAVEGGGDGGPLAHVEGEAVDLAEVAVEAGDKEALGWWRAARSVALPFAVDRAEGDSTQIGKSPTA